MAEIKNKFYLNQKVYVRDWLFEPEAKIYYMRIIHITMQNGGIMYACINNDLPAHSAFIEESKIFLTKKEAEHG